MMSAGTSDKQRVLKRQRNVRLAQLDRAFGYGPKGRGFESSNARTVTRPGENQGGFFVCRMKNKTSGLLVSSQTAALFEKIMGKQLVRSLTQVRYISYNKAKFKISKGDKLWLS